MLFLHANKLDLSAASCRVSEDQHRLLMMEVCHAVRGISISMRHQSLLVPLFWAICQEMSFPVGKGGSCLVEALYDITAIGIEPDVVLLEPPQPATW